MGTKRHVVLGMKHGVSGTVDAMTTMKYGDMRRGRHVGLRGELLVNSVRRRKDESKKSGEWKRIGKLEGRNVDVYAKNKKLQLQPLLRSRKKKRCDEPQDESGDVNAKFTHRKTTLNDAGDEKLEERLVLLRYPRQPR